MFGAARLARRLTPQTRPPTSGGGPTVALPRPVVREDAIARFHRSAPLDRDADDSQIARSPELQCAERPLTQLKAVSEPVDLDGAP